MPDLPPHDAERLIAALRDAARQSGVRRDDPMGPLILSFIRTVKFLSECTARSDRIAIDASLRIAQTVRRSWKSAEIETERFRAALAKTEAETVQRIATAVVETADAAWTRRVRVFDRNTAALAGFVLFAVAAACLAVGNWWGRSQTYSTIRGTEAGLNKAFIDGPDGALDWLHLMDWNNVRTALQSCDQAKGRVQIQDGRRWCPVPLWIEAPKYPQPGRP